MYPSSAAEATRLSNNTELKHHGSISWSTTQSASCFLMPSKSSAIRCCFHCSVTVVPTTVSATATAMFNKQAHMLKTTAISTIADQVSTKSVAVAPQPCNLPALPLVATTADTTANCSTPVATTAPLSQYHPNQAVPKPHRSKGPCTSCWSFRAAMKAGISAAIR